VIGAIWRSELRRRRNSGKFPAQFPAGQGNWFHGRDEGRGIRRRAPADRSKSALGFAEICARTACGRRSRTDCDWVAGSGLYHAGAIWAGQTPIRELHATCVGRWLWPFITSQRELRRSDQHHGRRNGKTCNEFPHAIPPQSLRLPTSEQRETSANPM